MRLYLEYLLCVFPQLDDHFYSEERTLPSVTEEEKADTPPLKLHISKLGYAIECSLKPYPGNDIFELLIEQYLMDGFVTSGDPLFVVQPFELETNLIDVPTEPLQLAPFSLGYQKGMARTVSLHALLVLCWQKALDLRALHPVLHKSIQLIHCHHTPNANKMDEALANMKLSLRGSIRKMVNVVQLAIMVDRLCKYGMRDFAVFTRKWNQMSGRSHQIIGKKALAMKYLFEVCSKDNHIEIEKLIYYLSHVSMSILMQPSRMAANSLCSGNIEW